jgi:hypothetical protein
LALIVILLRHRPVGRFGAFLAFLVCSTISDLLYFWLKTDTRPLYLLYWIIQAANGAVALSAVIGVFRDALQLVYRRFGFLAFLGPLVAFLLIDFFFWRKLQHGFPHNWLGVGITLSVTLVLGLALLQSAIAILCLWLRHRYGIFGRRSLSVVAGFGLTGGVAVMAYLMRVEFGRSLENVFRYMPVLASACAMLIWIVIFSLPEPEEDRQRYDPERFDRFLKLANRYVENVREAIDRWRLRYGDA